MCLGEWKLVETIRFYLTGVAMGGADLIPGVSGGTIAFILGVYERLLSAIKSVNLHFIKTLFKFKFKEAFSLIPWSFLVPLLLGIGTAILGMANLMKYLLENERVLLFAFFFGLVIASIFTVGRRINWGLGTIFSLICGAIAAYIIIGLVPMEMPHTPIYLFFSGAVAIMAMILPGISGSFILLILGQYKFILDAVTRYDVITILPVALGAVIGLVTFARVLSWLLKNYHGLTVAALVGFMVGSLRKVWPWKEVEGEIENNILPTILNQEVFMAIALAVLGFVFLIFIERLANKKS